MVPSLTMINDWVNGGTVSGEHGVGVGKIEHIEEEHGVEHINVMRDIKVRVL